MKTDVHITTCHHSEVTCRPRYNDRNIVGFNIEGWTQEERLEISKVSVDSILRFCDIIPPERLAGLTLIDDGSDMPAAKEWLNELNDSILTIERNSHNGSSYGINKHYAKMADCDLVAHFEDDHVMFNPWGLDWARLCYDFLTSKKVRERGIGVVTFRSGLPTSIDDPGIHGAWGAREFVKEDISSLLPAYTIHEQMGNAHHVMLRETYDRFMPLAGNTGGCEAYMNNICRREGILNAELQVPIYAFHSHTWSSPIPEPVTSFELSQSAVGIEYGIKEMHEHFKARRPIKCEWFKRWPDEYRTEIFTEYNY